MLIKFPLLFIAGCLSTVAALLHIAIIIGGPAWYRFFGAGEAMATMAKRGNWRATAITSAIAIVLFIWALYAFAAAGLMARLPLQMTALSLITVIYFLRGAALLPAMIWRPERVNGFIVWSSLICLLYAFCYGLGSWQYYQSAPAN